MMTIADELRKTTDAKKDADLKIVREKRSARLKQAKADAVKAMNRIRRMAPKLMEEAAAAGKTEVVVFSSYKQPSGAYLDPGNQLNYPLEQFAKKRGLNVRVRSTEACEMGPESYSYSLSWDAPRREDPRSYENYVVRG